MKVATAPELCQKCDFLLKKWTKEFFAYVLEFMLTSATMQDNSTLMCKNLRKLWLEHFESYSRFSYCTHGSAYLFWYINYGINISSKYEYNDFGFTANLGRDPYKPLWKFLSNLLIIPQYAFQIQWWIGKLTLNLWKKFRADFLFFLFQS